jgi:hypothetical protein
MARTTLTAQQVPAPYGAGLKLTLTAADVANKNQVLAANGLFILARNSGASPRTLTVTSVACPEGRTEDLVISLAAGEVWTSPIIQKTGFKQTDGYLYLEADHAEVLIAVMKQR